MNKGNERVKIFNQQSNKNRTHNLTHKYIGSLTGKQSKRLLILFYFLQ